MSRPLEGKTIVVTRPLHQAEALTAPLHELGAVVELIPALEIQPCVDGALRKAVARLEEFDWLVVTSVNGVAALDEEARRQGKRLDESTLKVAAVGSGTGEAMTAAGARAQHIPVDFTSKDLAERIAQHVPNCRVLLVQGTAAPSALADALTAAGARVQRVDAYRSVIPTAFTRQVETFFRGRNKADAVTFTSGQIAQNFFAALRASSITLPEGMVVASVGPVTTEALRKLGHPPVVEAKSARMEDFAAALGEFFRSRD